MIYLKNFNPFLMFYLTYTGTFILYWMEKTMIELGLTTTKHIWLLRGIGFCLIFAIIWEMIGIKEKEIKNVRKNN